MDKHSDLMSGIANHTKLLRNGDLTDRCPSLDQVESGEEDDDDDALGCWEGSSRRNSLQRPGAGKIWAPCVWGQVVKPGKAELNSAVARDLTLAVADPLVLWLGLLSLPPFHFPGRCPPTQQIVGTFLE